MMKQRKGELLAEEIGGDLQRQRFDSNVVVDSGVFCTSTRSVISAEAVRGMLEAKGFGKDRAIFGRRVEDDVRPRLAPPASSTSSRGPRTRRTRRSPTWRASWTASAAAAG